MYASKELYMGGGHWGHPPFHPAVNVGNLIQHAKDFLFQFVLICFYYWNYKNYGTDKYYFNINQ